MNLQRIFKESFHHLLEECTWGSRIRTADGEEGQTRGKNRLRILHSEQNCLHVIVQFVISSESIAPSNPNKAPDAPTDTFSPRESVKQDIRLPPTPEIKYKAPILTTHPNTEEADHVSQQVKETTVKPYASDETPFLTFLHKSPFESSKFSQPELNNKDSSLMNTTKS